MKPRILWCNESSVLHTGYGVYGKEILNRLHAANKYVLAEHAAYVHHSDPRIQNLPWTVYANLPDQDNKEQVARYNSDPVNQFGAWRFEEVCLNMMPHCVFDIRDNWMLSHEYRSPFRSYYNWVVMPTVDSFPQKTEWLSIYQDADGVFTYQDWSKQVLEFESGGRIKVLGAASPAAAPEFKPKPSTKEKFAFKDKTIFGTVMRNQRRKLFPDLFASFRILLNEINKSDIILHCHTTYPDMGWDIPNLLLRYDLTSKVTFTYKCNTCKHIFPDYFHDIIHLCPKCGDMAASFVSGHNGVNNEELSNIYNMFDLYIQYSNSEGLGLPQLEAAACGIPIISVDHSAMSDVVRKLKGQPVSPIALNLELETGCFRAIPNNDEFIKILKRFLELNEQQRNTIKQQTYEAYHEHYSWDKTAQKWMQYFDNVNIDKYEKLWLQKPQYIELPTRIPTNLSNKEFARWIILTYLKEERFIHSFLETRLIRDLNYGITSPGISGMYYNDESASPLFHMPHVEEFNREKAVQHFAALANRKNQWEHKRWQKVKELAKKRIK